MEHTFNSSVYAVRLPLIIAFIVLAYLIIKGISKYLEKNLSAENKDSLTRFYDFLDPYRQSIFCYKYNWFSAILIVALIYTFCWIYIPPDFIYAEKGVYAGHNFLHNSFSYLVNFIVHENAGHNFFCPFTPKWFCYFSGSFMEILIPFFIYMLSLRLRGGVFFSPILLYWLSTALYSVGIYASDGRINQLSLVSSDMITTHAGGTVKGDWHYILEPLGILNHAEVIGFLLEIAACVTVSLAIYSIIEYFRRLLQKDIADIM